MRKTLYERGGEMRLITIKQCLKNVPTCHTHQPTCHVNLKVTFPARCKVYQRATLKTSTCHVISRNFHRFQLLQRAMLSFFTWHVGTKISLQTSILSQS